MTDLREEIIRVLESTDKPLSVKDILKSLKGKCEFRPSTVRQELRDLEEKHRIISFTKQRGTAGRPGKFYRSIQKKEVLSKTVTREAFERENILQGLIEDSAGRYSMMPFEEAQSIFKATAEGLLKEDPRDLFIRFAEWLKLEHESQIKSYKENKNQGLRIRAEKHRRNVSKLEKIGNEVFNRMIGVPSQIRQTDDSLKKGPFILKLNARTLEDDSNINSDRLNDYIEWAIQGRYVLEKLKINQVQSPLHIGGSDASIQGISLSKLLPWLVERSEMNIITAVGVRYDIFKDTTDLDRYPEPKVLAQYERSQAIEEGLLIPPSGTLGYRPDMETRIKEAAMDLRQYLKDFDLMFRNEPAVKINFRDGRIFPLEHRLSDALQIGFHGDMVRSSLKAFRNIVNMIGTVNGRTLYCGFVKRPGLEILAPLIMWYIGFGSEKSFGETIDPEMTLNDFLRSPYSDNYIVHQLFFAINDLREDNEIFLTFRLLRRFQSMEEPYIQNFPPSTSWEDWAERLNRFNVQYFGSGGEEPGVDIIANLCSRAAIVQFYCSLAINPYYEPHAQLPRLEFLLPYSDFDKILSSPKSGDQIQLRYIEEILGTLFHPGVLENYPDSLYYFKPNSPDVFFVPKSVHEAHIASKAIGQVYRDDFIELLVREAKIYWLTKTRRFSSY